MRKLNAMVFLLVGHVANDANYAVQSAWSVAS